MLYYVCNGSISVYTGVFQKRLTRRIIVLRRGHASECLEYLHD
jgi:hypothetical protein